ncbi:MAG: serine/threonine-protein phosphatase, partial [Eubacterium sp.]|nr:serine/threonine-protein phosphatase [Eubacterium sp.]
MGTTASILCFYRDYVVICNVGDTPIFRFRFGGLEPIFEEHSQKVFFEKLFGKEFLGNRKFPLTQCIGVPESVMQIRPYINTEEIIPGDRYLICSDGLTDMITEDRINEIMETELAQDQLLSILVKESLENGGKDNITAILIEVLP